MKQMLTTLVDFSVSAELTPESKKYRESQSLRDGD